MVRRLITLCVVSICIPCVIGCVSCTNEDLHNNSELFQTEEGIPSDRQLIQSQLERRPPGYSSIEILDRQGDGTPENPRVLTIQVTMNSYPNSVVCEGELVFFYNDPSYLEIEWYTLEGVGHSLLVQWASQSLKYWGPQEEMVSLLLKRWIDNGLIELDDIMSESVRLQVKSWIEDPASEPAYNYDAGLFDTTQIQTYDLAPELPDDQKVPIYILLSDEYIVEIYLVDEAVYHDCNPGDELPWGTLLPSPVPRPAEGNS